MDWGFHMTGYGKRFMPIIGLLLFAIILNSFIPVSQAMWKKILFIGGSVSIREEEPTPPPFCPRTIGFWKNHAGCGGKCDDLVTPLLPIWLGEKGAAKAIEVTTAEIAVDILEMKTYGHPSNGITKLYAQLLGTKLNLEAGYASGGVVMDSKTISQHIKYADSFLAGHDWQDWDALDAGQKKQVLAWKDVFDKFNNSPWQGCGPQ